MRRPRSDEVEQRRPRLVFHGLHDNMGIEGLDVFVLVEMPVGESQIVVHIVHVDDDHTGNSASHQIALGHGRLGQQRLHEFAPVFRPMPAEFNGDDGRQCAAGVFGVQQCDDALDDAGFLQAGNSPQTG